MSLINLTIYNNDTINIIFIAKEIIKLDHHSPKQIPTDSSIRVDQCKRICNESVHIIWEESHCVPSEIGGILH